MDRFDAMTVFARVVEAGSLSAAARSIPMSLTSVSRHLAALEQRLGTQLLRRTTRHLSLTDEGRLVYDRAKAILSELQEMEMTLSANRSEPSGRLRVSAPVLIGRLLIAPQLPAFLARHPLVDIDLLLIDRAVNLVEEDIAVAVRVGRLPDSSLVARQVGSVRRVVVASPAYLARRGVPRTPSDLAKHDTIFGMARSAAREWRFGPSQRGAVVRLSPRLLVDDVEALLQAAQAGRGIARVLSYQVRDEVASGSLVRLLQDFEPELLPVQLVTSSRSHMAPKVRVFLDSAVKIFRDVDVIR